MLFTSLNSIVRANNLYVMEAISRRRKSTVQKYDPPYSKKPPSQKSYSSVSGNHHAETAALDTVNKILTFGRMPHYRYDDHFVAYISLATTINITISRN